jgi:hypothetical protein
MEKAIADACAILYGGKEDTRLEDFLRELLARRNGPHAPLDQTAATHSANPDGPKARKIPLPTNKLPWR